MSCDLSDIFADCYEAFSLDRLDLVIPPVCNVYLPDNADDYTCISIIEPAPELGSSVWTSRGKRILIGVYRDEGRAATRRPARTVPWVRTVNKVVLTDSIPHRLVKGSVVDVYNTNIDEARVKVNRVVDAYSFEVLSLATGAASGSTGGYSPLDPVDFYETRLVFRYLPSYKLVPYAAVNALLTSCLQSFGFAPVDLTDIVTGDIVHTMKTVFNGVVLQANGSRKGTELHRQQFDEVGKPLSWTYDSRGNASSLKTVSSKHQNVRLRISPPLVAEGDSEVANEHLYIKDYYGYEVNDTGRGQYHADDLVTYDSTQANGLKRKTVGSEVLYTGPLHDEFGNFVIGANPNNTVNIRQPILPLKVDQFNHPYKAPLPRSSS